ncbi:MAG TPA: prepilin-type N-terminal cleavage/methylation domain-containing protein [Opitutaceae bacterium]|nr:prepilin-type N-terminal cleavage/methylation domain-containing protein [Opitutaceae bacterium]
MRISVPGGARRRAGGRAFTLLEILIAMALVALVLVALNTFIFSMSELWGRRNESRLFDLHVRAVTRFLQNELRTASLPPEAQIGATPVTAQEIRPANGSSDNLLTFELPDGCRLFNWPGPPLPDVICSLQVRPSEGSNQGGLFLLWHSKLEKHFSDDPPREVQVTPFVTAMAYDYYDSDSKRWQTETTLRKDSNGQSVTPQRLRLDFAYHTLKRQTILTLPTPGQGLPDY